ncbi:MAG TPA: ABC transporter permease [Candidatus Margulisiibacteriota bacterium]|nr:ABC transporter permease [Candidatus Margulisiibacteriota bacterium]
MGSFKAMVRKEFLHIRRDPQLIGFVLGLPVLLLILFGYALRLKVDNLTIAVWDDDHNFFSEQVKDRLQRKGKLIVIDVKSESEVKGYLQSGAARMGLHIPKGFAERLGNNQQTTFRLYVDGSMPTLAQAGMYGASVLTDEESAEQLIMDDPDHPAPPFRKPPIKIEQEILYNPNLRDSDFFLPGTIGIVIMVVVLQLTANLVREREQGTMEQLLVTPITRFSLITGKMIPYGLIGAFDFVVVSILAKLVFNLPFMSVAPVAALAALFILALLMVGAFLSTIAQTQVQHGFLIVFVIIPSLLMSGFVFPIEAIPGWLQPVAWSLPMTYFVEAIRGFTLKGTTMADEWRAFAALAGFMVGFTILSLARFRKTLA